MANNINCTCGHSWSKASSSGKDMYVCHVCGKDNTMKDGGWLSKFDTAQYGKFMSNLISKEDANLNKNRGDMASYFPEIKRMKDKPENEKAIVKNEQKIKKQNLAKAVANAKGKQETVKQDNRTDWQKEFAQQQVVDAYLNEAQGNSPLAQTFGSFTPSGYNPGAGSVAANQFVKTMPLIAAGSLAATEVLPYLGSAMNAPIAGVAGLTGNNIMNAGFAYEAAKNLPNVGSSIKTAYQNPTLGNIGNAALETGVTALDILPFVADIAPGAKAAGKYLTEQTTLKNPFALTESELFNQSNASKFFKRKKIDLLSDRIDTGLQSYLGGISAGLQEKLLALTSKGKEKGRSFSEMFPMSKSEKAKAIAEGKAANLAAEKFVEDWVYDATGQINPEVKRKINDIMFSKGSPYATGFQQNYSPFANINNPLYTTPNLMVSTRYNDLINNPYLTDVGISRILKNRAEALGVNYASTNYFPASYTFQNIGPYNYPILEKLSTAVHEGAHTMQELGAFEAGKNLNQIGGNRGTGFGSILAKYDKDYKYWVPNTDTEIGRQFAEVMPTPIKGKSNWKTSPNELHSELMAARKKLLDAYVTAGHSYEDALKAARTDTDKTLDFMIESQNLNRFFKKDVSQEKKREMLRLLPAAIPVVGAVGAMDDNEEQKRNGGWLSKFEQGGMVLEQKGDNYGKKPNPNEVDVSVSPDFVGLSYDTTGRNYSPAWGGQFQNGGNLWNTNKTAWVDSIHNARKGDLNFVQRMFDQRAGSIQIPGQLGTSTHYMESGDGKAYPTVVQMPNGKLQYLNQNDKDAAWNYANKTGQFIKFPNDEQAEWYANNGYKKGTNVLKKAMGGSLPGAVGFTYARTINPAPSNGKYAKKTKASAQNGKEMKFYQEGLDFKPNSIAQDGGAILDPMGQWAHPGEVTIIPGTDITMEGVDYPVLGISDTGDQQMMYPGEDYNFDGDYVTEYPMMQEGGWLSKYQEKVPSDATRVAAPVRLTDKEQKQNVRINKQTQKNTKEYNKAVIADRKSKRETKGDVNVPGSFNITEKLRLFPESVGGVGEIINEYLNPGTIIGPLADSLGESIAARSPEGVAATLAMTAGAGALGFDPLGGAIKTVKSFTKPSFADGKEALTYLNNVSDNVGEEEFLKTLIKKTGKTKEQLEVDFAAAIGNDATPKDPKVIINYANALRGKTNLPKLPKSLKELDEQAGKLVSPPSSSKFDNAEIVNRANEILEKGVGIKKKDIPVKLKVDPDNEIGVYVNDYDKSGYIELAPNFSTVNKSSTFTDWLKGKKPTTVYDTYAKDQPAAMIKTGDFPYKNIMSLEGTGVGAEAAEALKQALNEKGLQLYSSKSHTELGKLRYLTEFLNNRKQVVDYSDNPYWMNYASALRDQLGGSRISKKEVKEYLNQYPELNPTQVRFQYDNGGWLNKYK
jgi:hypothetical protein